MSALDLAQRLRSEFPELISEPTEFRGEITLWVADAERIAAVCAFCKSELAFDYLVDVSSIDNYGEDPRFVVVYHLQGLGHLRCLRLKTAVSEEKGELPTVTGVWRTADCWGAVRSARRGSGPAALGRGGCSSVSDIGGG